MVKFYFVKLDVPLIKEKPLFGAALVFGRQSQPRGHGLEDKGSLKQRVPDGRNIYSNMEMIRRRSAT